MTYVTILDLFMARPWADWVNMHKVRFCKKKFCILSAYFVCLIPSIIMCNQVLLHLCCFYENKQKFNYIYSCKCHQTSNSSISFSSSFTSDIPSPSFTISFISLLTFSADICSSALASNGKSSWG